MAESKKHAKTHDPLPESFDTIEDFITFWDTHSTADYPEAFREVGGTTKVQRRRFYRVALAPSLGAQLALHAQKEGTTLDALVNRLLQQCIHLRA